MDYRILNIIETLKSLPPPTRDGEVRTVRILVETWEMPTTIGEAIRANKASTITVKAQVFGRGHNRWLEWMWDI